MRVDPGEFLRGAAAREEDRAERERAALEELLTAGWNKATVAEARRLHDAIGEAVAQALLRTCAPDCNETALELVGEAHGRALAEWWAKVRRLDDDTRRLLTECAGIAAAMAMADGYLLGRNGAAAPVPAGAGAGAPTASPAPQAPTNGRHVAVGVA
jgi:hypothetical protein